MVEQASSIKVDTTWEFLVTLSIMQKRYMYSYLYIAPVVGFNYLALDDLYSLRFFLEGLTKDLDYEIPSESGFHSNCMFLRGVHGTLGC